MSIPKPYQPRPYNEGPEMSPCGQYALFTARFGENDTVFNYIKGMSMWEYMEIGRAAREN